MSGRLFTTPCLCVIFIICCLTLEIDGRILKSDDEGKAENCADPKHNFTLTWSPKSLKRGQKYDIKLDITPAVDFSRGQACVKLYASFTPDPILDVCEVESCENVKKFVPYINCPVKKGVPFHKEVKEILTSSIPLPEGDYSAEVTIKNQNGELLVCARAKFHIDPVD